MHQSLPISWIHSLVVCGVLLLNVAGALAQQENTPPKEVKKVLATKDSQSIAITYWGSLLKQEASVVLLVHQLHGNQLEWGRFPVELQNRGYAVVSMDLRKHGLSKSGGDVPEVEVKPKTKSKPKTTKGTAEAESFKPNDYKAMVLLDIEAVKNFIKEEHQAKRLNMNKLAVIGGGMGATLALNFAMDDWLKKPYNDGPVGNQTPRGQDVRALVLLSPVEVPMMPWATPVKTLKAPAFKVAVMFGVGAKDKTDKGLTEKMYDQYISALSEEEKARIYLQKYNSAEKAAGLLGRQLPTEDNIYKFLELHLQQVSSEWRDRESRLK